MKPTTVTVSWVALLKVTEVTLIPGKAADTVVDAVQFVFRPVITND